MSILDEKYYAEIKNYIKQNFYSGDIIIFNNLKIKYLVNLYKKSKLYIFSSYCEVFGLTSLEAMTQKTPVLISDRSAIPEINEKNVVYFNPDKISEIYKGMTNLIDNKNLRNKLIKKAYKHSQKFRWNKTVSKTIKILQI